MVTARLYEFCLRLNLAGFRINFASLRVWLKPGLIMHLILPKSQVKVAKKLYLCYFLGTNNILLMPCLKCILAVLESSVLFHTHI